MSFYVKIISGPVSENIFFRQKVHLGQEKSVRLTPVHFIIFHFIEVFLTRPFLDKLSYERDVRFIERPLYRDSTVF